MGRKKLLPEAGRTGHVHVRVHPPWRGWLDRYAAFKEMSVTALVQWAVAKAAKGDKFEAPPKVGELTTPPKRRDEK